MLFPTIGHFSWLPNFGLVQTCCNILRLSTEYYVTSAHPKCIYVVANRKIASVNDDSLETDVRSASSVMDATDLELLEPSVGTVLVTS
jgi:hypothetical protein